MYFVLIIVIQLACYAWTLRLKRKNPSLIGKNNFLRALLQILILYISILLAIYLYDLQLELEVNQFDLDGDGFFSDSEQTPEQREAMRSLTSDTGRKFAPITVPFFILPLLPVAYALELLVDSIAKKSETSLTDP